MNILIIEKSLDSFKLIAGLLAEYFPMLNLTHCQSIQEAQKWLSANETVNLGLFEVEMPDGLSFEIFQGNSFAFPVVYMSSCDKYLAQAMSFNAMDYLRKPVERAEVVRVLDKYEAFRRHFINAKLAPYSSLVHGVLQGKDRLIVKKGTNYCVVKTSEIAFVYTEARVVFLIDKGGERYIVEKNLGELELELSGSRFFRANRKFIVNIDAIKSFKSSFKGKIALELMHLSKAEVSISQENATQFRRWIEG